MGSAFAKVVEVALLGLSPAWSGSEAQSDMVDLTKPLSASARSYIITCGQGMSFGGPARFIHAPPVVMPLEVVLLPPDRTEYRLQEDLVFELRITNRGEGPYRIPWGSQALVERILPDPCHPPSGYMVFGLSLEGQPLDTMEWMWAGSLWGSDLVPESLRDLQPGESVRVRALARMLPRSNRPPVLPLSLTLKAVLSPFEGYTPPTKPDPKFSSNAITIKVIPKP